MPVWQSSMHNKRKSSSGCGSSQDGGGGSRAEQDASAIQQFQEYIEALLGVDRVAEPGSPIPRGVPKRESRMSVIVESLIQQRDQLYTELVDTDPIALTTLHLQQGLTIERQLERAKEMAAFIETAGERARKSHQARQAIEKWPLQKLIDFFDIAPEWVVAEYLASEAEFDAGAKRDYIKKIITILMQPHVGPLVELKTYVQDCRDGFDSEASMEQEDFNGCNAEVQSILQKLGILLLLSYPKCPPRIVNQQLAASVKVPDSVAGIVAALLSIVEKLKKHFNNYMDNRTTVLNVKLIDQCVQVLQACYPALYQAFEAYVKDSSRTAVDENDCEDSDDAAAVIVATSANSATAFVANRRQPSLGSGPEHCSGSGSTKTGITSLANQ